MVLELAARLRKHGIAVAGIACPGLWEEGRRSGFELLELDTGKKMPLARRVDGLRPVPYRFDAQGLKKGDLALSEKRCKNAGVVVIDEIGKLELAGGGWAGSLEHLLALDGPVHLWVVRTGLADRVKANFRVEPQVFTVHEMISKIEKRLIQLAANARNTHA
jgi:nucleoside-triphosphatase THEP1